jgi:hypothetical protein
MKGFARRNLFVAGILTSGMVAGIGIWFDWPAVTVPGLIAWSAIQIWQAWTDRDRPAEPAERVLKWYPKWW